MGWDGRFFEQIGKTQNTPIFVVESEVLPGFNPLVPGIRLSSHHIGGGYVPAIVPGSVRVRGGEVHPGEWSYVFGSAEVGIHAGTDIRWQAPRGSLIRLKVGYPGTEPADMNTVFLGHLQDVVRTWQPGVWVLQIRDAVAGLLSRWDDTTQQTDLFHDVGATTAIITVQFLTTDTTMNVADTSAWQRDSGGSYWIRVAPIQRCGQLPGGGHRQDRHDLHGVQRRGVDPGGHGRDRLDRDLRGGRRGPPRGRHPQGAHQHQRREQRRLRHPARRVGDRSGRVVPR